MYTPDNITELKENEVFVFGSNGQGNHCWWTARLAKEKFWAIEWQSEWIQGQSYWINTMDWISKIKEWLGKLSRYAQNNPNKIFYLTKIGCWIAWYMEREIKDIIWYQPSNVIKPKWR